jgi:20S proteasome alpha/beta subunit
MTAILGLSYLDGVLMMGDTEESLGGDSKSECDKLYRFIFPSGTVITCGAGDSHLIDCANQELTPVLCS